MVIPHLVLIACLIITMRAGSQFRIFVQTFQCKFIGIFAIFVLFIGDQLTVICLQGIFLGAKEQPVISCSTQCDLCHNLAILDGKLTCIDLEHRSCTGYMCHYTCISSILRNLTGWCGGRFRCSCRLWCDCRCGIRRVCVTLCDMDDIINIMRLCHGDRRSGDRHICIQNHRNLKAGTIFIACRLIFFAVHDQLRKTAAAEFDRCIGLAVFYRNTLTGDLGLSCTATE